jgi:hypothetical protein
MNNIEINVAGRAYKFTLPSTWDEMTSKELMDICRLSRCGLAKEPFMISAVICLLPIEVRNIVLNLYTMLVYAARRSPIADQREEFTDASMDVVTQFVRLIDLMNWLAEPSTLTKNPLSTVNVGWRKYRGPKDGLKDITYYDFALVDLLLRDITYAMQEDRQADAETAKAKIMAVLWKKPGEQYDERRAEARAKAFSRLPVEWKDAVYMFVTGSIRQIISSYPRIFSSSGESGNALEDTYGHAELILDLAGGKFGDIEKTQNTPLHTILLYLEHEARKAEKKQSQNV